MERPAHAWRPGQVKRTWLFTVACSGVLIMTACTSPAATGTPAVPVPASATPPTYSPTPQAAPECEQTDLAVSVDVADLSIRVKNTSTAPCALSGQPPATMTVGRFVGPDPKPTTVVVPPGWVYIQPQVLTSGWACPGPISSGLPGTGYWTVTVENHQYHPVAPAQLLRLVVNCDVFQRVSGYISP